MTYGFFHGYRHLMNEGIAAAHAFGEGLSSTTFSSSGPTLSAGTIAPGEAFDVGVTVTNTGAAPGIETVMIFVAPIGSRVVRAPHDLRGFAQIELAPGASGAVTISIDSDDLAFWDETSDAFVVEPIDYEIRVGRSAEDVVASAVLSIR